MYTQTRAETQTQDESQRQARSETPSTEEERAELSAPAGPAESAPRWGLAKRVVFRFVCAYLVLYNIPFPLGEPTFTSTLVEKYENLWHPVVQWVGKHVLRLSYDITVFTNGSGDTTYDYVRALCFLAIAAFATLVWSVLDRRRPGYARLYDWLRLYVRFALGLTMIVYGSVKLIPLQMPAPYLTRLLEPYGDSSPMGLLWTFVGASPAFEMLTGGVEILGGLLLILPRTTLLGAVVCLADTAFIFTLNMCYDVPVKLYSFHLVLMSLFLVAQDSGRLANVFLLNRPVEPAAPRPLFKRRRLERGALVFQIVFGLYLLGFSLHGAYQQSKVYGFNAPKPPLYGIWVVDEFTADGQTRPPLTTDAARWQRVIFQTPKSVMVQPMTGPNQPFTLELNEGAKTLTLGKRDDPNWKAVLTYRDEGEGRMAIEGDFDGHATRALLTRFDDSKFLLKSRGFNWIQERPFNR
jgi:uncharacterized membrane protein YphA (DoxX/SURF4 family)